MFITKQKIDKFAIINDYNFRRYLKPYKRIIFPAHCENILINKRIPYIIINASKIIIGYKIKTINGDISFPVLDYNIWKNRLILSSELFYAIKKKFLYNNTKLPNELIHLILNYLFPLTSV